MKIHPGTYDKTFILQEMMVMGLSVCSVVTDLHDQELSGHGDTAFPIACYDEDLSREEVSWHCHEE